MPSARQNTPRRQVSFGNVYTNPIFSLNEGSSGAAGPFSGHVARGFIEQEYPPPGQRAKERLNFLYNPSIISASYSLNTDFIDPAQQTDAELAGLFYATGRGFAIDILFDRTLEVWRGDQRQDLHNLGVNVDIAQLERTVGITQEGQPLFLMMVNVWLMPFRSLAGIAQSMSVTYTHFSARMVPTRCTVNLAFIQSYELPEGAGDISATPGSGASWREKEEADASAKRERDRARDERARPWAN